MQAQGGEDMLLDEFEGLGLHCEARTQLVVLCEVCSRPATKECWTCRMKICDFCTLKRHWKVRCTQQPGLFCTTLTHRRDAVLTPGSFIWTLSCLSPLLPIAAIHPCMK